MENMFSKLTDYFKSSWSELVKVSWPTRQQAIKLTALVIVFSIVIAGFIGAVDWGFSQVLERVILR